MFGVRRSSAIETYCQLLWYPDTYDLARGLSLGNHSPSLYAAVVEQSGRRVLFFLDPSASPVGAPFLFLSPPVRGENFPPPPPRFHGRSASWSYRTTSPISPDAEDPF